MKSLSTVCMVLFLSSVFSGPLTAQGTDADRKWVLTQLSANSPDGYYVVNAYETNPGKHGDFMADYWDDSDENARWDSINTIVHELAHGYMALFGGYGTTCYYISRTESVKVAHSKVYMTKEMVPAFPDNLRTERFDVYVNCDDRILGSQQHGAYGLLDEMAAYYIGTKASFDMLPSFLAKKGGADWSAYFLSVDGTLFGILEFRLYILKYLLFAKEKHPDVYAGIMGNADFARAFTRLDLTSRSFIEQYFAKRKELFATLKGYGLRVDDRDDSLFISGSGSGTMHGYGTNMEVFRLLDAEMAKKTYTNLVSELYGKAGAVPPVPGPAAASAAVPAAVPDSTPSAGTESGKSRQTSGGMPASSGAGAQSTRAAQPEPEQVPSSVVVRRGFPRKATAPSGDVAMGAFDITGARVDVDSSGAVFTIDLRELPVRVPLGAAGLEEDVLECMWGIDIDLEGDGTIDFSVSMDRFKPKKEKAGIFDPLDYTQLSLWKVDDDCSSYIPCGLTAERADRGLKLTVPSDAGMPGFGDSTRFTVRTYWTDGSSRIIDTLEL